MDPQKARKALSTISLWLAISIFNVVYGCMLSIRYKYDIENIDAINLFLNELNVFFDTTKYYIYINEGIVCMVTDLKHFYGIEEKGRCNNTAILR